MKRLLKNTLFKRLTQEKREKWGLEKDYKDCIILYNDEREKIRTNE